MFPFRCFFRAAAVLVLSDRVETRLAGDGPVAVARVDPGDPDHIAAASHAGYGDDQRRMLAEHEIAHTYIAVLLDWPHAWSAWSAAHGGGDKRPMSEWSPRVRNVLPQRRASGRCFEDATLVNTDIGAGRLCNTQMLNQNRNSSECG